MLITQISYAGFIMLSVEEEKDKPKVILRVYAMVTVWIHSTAKLGSAIIRVSCYGSLGNTNSKNDAMSEEL
jgi:hypothetical protein